MVFAAKGTIYYVAIAVMIFSHVKIMLFSRVKIFFQRAKAHLVFHWCLYRYLKIDCIIAWELLKQDPPGQKEHTKLYKILKFGVFQANNKQDTAIQNL